ncbi:MAG: hypothetical protein BGO77_04955 [Caedibacter sp. 37-49]|nr:MAG: hypothetical protein BGO77_04955 [Caedibacter sp. 37-49]
MNHKNKIYSFLNEMWNTKTEQLDELHNIFSDKLIATSPLGDKIGSESLKGTNITWSHGFPDMALSNIDIFDANNVVISEWRSQGTNIEEFNGFKPTGKKVDYTGVTIFQFEGEKVVRYKCIINMLDIYDQLGFFLEQETYEGQKLARKNHASLIEKLKTLTSNALLSTREIECLSFFVHGWSAKQIGAHLKCSYRTIQNHLSSAMDKLGCHSRIQVFDYLVAEGLKPLFEDLYKLCFNNYFTKELAA